MICQYHEACRKEGIYKLAIEYMQVHFFCADHFEKIIKDLEKLKLKKLKGFGHRGL